MTRIGLDDVDQVMLVWSETRSVLEASFAALQRAFPVGWRGRLVLVANGAERETLGAARALAGNAWPLASKRLLRIRRNLGFGRAINIGVSATCAPYVAVFNPDGEVDPMTPIKLARVLDENPTAFSACAAFQRRTPGAREPEVIEVQAMPGGAVVMRRDAFIRVGGYDPMYYLYWEDNDLSQRARRAGMMILRHTEAFYHHPGRAFSGFEWHRRLFVSSVSEAQFVLSYAHTRGLGLRDVLGRRRRRFAEFLAQRSWARMATLTAATLAVATKLHSVGKRRRSPWTGVKFLRWLRMAEVLCDTEELVSSSP